MARNNLTTVAREADVAMSTASLALNGRATPVDVAEDTARRVRETAERLDYAPTQNARSLSRISVPYNCSDLSLNDHELLDFKRIPVTAMVEDATAIGQCSAEVALDLIASRNGAVTHERLICHRLIERATMLPLAHPIP